MAEAKKAEQPKLPLSLKREDLAKLELSYGFYSAKTGAGEQEVFLHGDGRVRLKLTRAHDAEPEYRDGKLEPEVLLRLLELLESQGLMTLEDEYPDEEGPPRGRRILTLTTPGTSKRVIVNEPDTPREFERMAGALLLAAGLATPDALLHRFFPNL